MTGNVKGKVGRRHFLVRVHPDCPWLGSLRFIGFLGALGGFAVKWFWLLVMPRCGSVPSVQVFAFARAPTIGAIGGHFFKVVAE